MSTIIEKIKEHFVTLLITTVVTVITLFSDKIVEKIKFAVNRSDLRISHYEKLASDISFFVFAAENTTECFEYG